MSQKVFVCLLVVMGAIKSYQGPFVNPGITTRCAFYNSSCSSSDLYADGCNEVDECEEPSDGKRNHCFVLWRANPDGTHNVSLKGCFLNNEDCYNRTRCVEEQRNPKYLFCCCEGNMCNQNFTWEPASTEATPISTEMPIPTTPGTWRLYMVAGAMIIIFTIFIIYTLIRKKKFRFTELPTLDSRSMQPPSPLLDTRLIQLIEVKARGRFGAVWKAQFKSEEVAVKIFPLQDKQSWLSEQEIYKLPLMSHPNILQFIGAEKHGENLQAEYWLITAYHDRGSLCDYLKAYTLTWPELLQVAETIAKGLMHLHEHIPPKYEGERGKPAIAHRDFKSKNVLLKSDMSACIADFGLALVFEAGESCGVTHGQVGTRRYMAPEVLEGAIDFNVASFLRIDLYACALVLWELMSRCTAQPGPIAEYRLPFEDEVGPHPTLEDMQDNVVQRKVRPKIHDHWRHHSGLSVLCDTVEECWDHDAEARLSASCVMERVSMLRKNLPKL